MKTVTHFLLWATSISAVILLSLFAYQKITDRGTHQNGILSPLPDFFSSSFSDAADASYWKPNVKSLIDKTDSSFSLTAESVLSYDIGNDKVLYAKNSDEKLPMASLTKIMTAIVVLENMYVDNTITVSKNAAEIGENSMGLSEGEVHTVEDLLYGLILMSGNDAAEALAQGSPFGREGFLHLMNKRAETIGVSDTRFTNPSGLQGDGLQYTTAEDLLVLTKHALTIPEFAKIVETYQHDIPQTASHKGYTLYNETNLLTTYPGVKGVKTGFTDEAGMCLVTYLDYNGNKIIAILLNSQNRRQEMKDLLDFSLQRMGVVPPPHT